VVGCVVAVAGTLVLGMAFLAGVWWLYRQIEEHRQARLGPPPPLVEMSDEEFQTEVASGFRQANVGVDAGTLKSIERFFREANRVRDKEAEAPEVLKLIDGRRALAAIERSPNCVKLLPVDRISLRGAPFSHNPFSQAGSPNRIVHVALKENGQEAVVCGYFPDPNGDLRPMRWWLIRASEGWRLFNWEDCGSGRSEVEEIAIMMSLTYRRPQAWDFFNTLANEAEAIADKPYLVADGQRRLAALDVTALDERLFDDGVMRVAFACCHLGDYRRCLELCDLVKRPQIRPDVERARTFCLEQLQRWEETAQAAERYERLIGPTPVVLVSWARALARLSRPQEAEQTWRRVLAVSPTDRDALVGWAGLIPENRKQELVEHLRVQPDSHRHAQQLVEELCAYDDEAGARTVADWLAKEAPDTRESLEAAADLKNFDEEFAAAATLYLAAYAKATSDEERSSLLHSYLSAMAAAGRQIEAHAQAPDKRAVLEAFWYDYGDDGIYELTRRKLQTIVAQHKQSEPQDPLLAEIEASLLSDEGRHAEAEKILVAALANLGKQPDADREEMLKDSLVDALLSQGKWKEALAQRPNHYDLVRMTGQLLAQNRQADARALVDHVQRTTPEEPALYLCRAELLRAEKKYAQAWNALPPPNPIAARDHPLAWRLNHLVSDLVVKDETLLSSFAGRAPDNAIWDALATDLRADDRWATLAKVVEMWRRMHPSQPEVLYWDASVKSHAKDHAAVAALLTQPLTDPATAERLNYRRRELHLLLVESLLALGRTDEARQHGQHVLKQETNNEPLLLALLGAGDVTAIEQAVDSSSAEADRSSRWLPYYQPRFAALMTDDRFLPLRRSHPPAVEYDYLDDRVTLLLADQEPPSPATVQERIAAALPGASFRPLALAGASPRIQALEAQRGDERWLISIGSGPCAPRERLQEAMIKDPQLREAVLAHGSWIQFDRGGNPAVARSAAALAAELRPPPGSVVFVESHSRLALWDETLAKRLASPPAGDDLADIGESVFLDVRGDETKPVGRRAWRQFQRQYRNRQPDDKPFRVQIEVSRGAARERLWFRISQPGTSGPGNDPLVGTAESDSLLRRTLKAGEPRQIERYHVLAIDPAD
jgi:hypothetical protein